MAATVVYWCPRCLDRTEEPVPVCARCGLPQTGEDVARLRVIVHRLHEIGVAEHELQRERDELLGEQQQLMALASGSSRRARAGSRPGVPQGARPAASGDVRADVVRDVLLWVGGLLLAIAALTFAAFAWRRLDDGGRAALLVLTTLASVAAAFGLRRRLPATAEVFAALGIALFLIDWLALRQAGAGDTLDLPTWWAVGSGAAAALALALGQRFSSARVLTAIAASASVFLAIGAGTRTAPATSAALSIAAVGAVAGATAMRRARWDGAASTFVVAACGAVAGAAIAVYVGVADDGEASVGIALAASFVAAGPLAAAVLLARDRRLRDALVAVSAVAILAGAAIGWWLRIDEPWLASAVAVTSLALAAVASVSPSAVRPGAFAGSIVVLVVALGFAFEVMATAVGGPLVTVEDVWGAPADRAVELVLEEPVSRAEAAASIVSVVCLVAACLLGALHRRDRAQRRGDIDALALVGGGAGAVVVALVPLTFDATAITAAVITSLPALAAVVALGWLARRGALVPSSGAGLVAATAVLVLPAVGWGLTAEATTLLVASGALVATTTAMVLAPARTTTRQLSGAGAGASLVVLAVAGAMSAGGSSTEAGIVAVAAAGGVLAGSTLWARTEHRDDGVGAELVALLGLAVGLAMALEDDLHRAVAVTLVVPAFAAAGTRPDRRGYLVSGSISAVLATWAWLHAADLRLLEAYTVPAALGALAAGQVVRSTDRDAGSWAVYGPGLLIAFAPSLALAVADDVALRAVLVAAAAVLITWAGGQRRLQAPLVIGIASVVVLAMDTVGPIAAELPRWLTIAIVGAVLVWLGATAERRLEQLRATRDRLTAMEHDPESAGASEP